MSQSDIKERKKTRHPLLEAEDADDLEKFQGKWGIYFLITEGRSCLDPDEIYDTEEECQSRIDEFFSTRNQLSRVHIRGLGWIDSMDVTSAYPQPITGE